MEITRTGIQIGSLFIHFYGVILMLGAVAGAVLADREARRRKINTDLIWDALIWVLIGGIVGARLWHVLTPPPSMVEQGITTLYYFTHPLDLINTRAGGLGIPGAVIGGGLALYFFCRRKKLNFLTFADIAAPSVALGQAIGRWGNFVNQELYGKPSTLPWAIKIDPVNRLPEYMQYETFHPLFLYESLWNLANMFLLIWLGRKKPEWLKTGDLFLIYLVTYPVGRFLLEFLRLDSPTIGTINTNQTVMLIVALVSIGLLLWRHGVFGRKETPAE
jgi:phosphatidylglycerol:prolipoprotein diacylglycerol transferase